MRTARSAAAEPTETEIQHQAYLLWLEGGRRAGGKSDGWSGARERLHHRHGGAPTGKSAGIARNITAARN
ncbi:MAG: hypothetical protein H7343_05710 [Undibacterium sp.]|nr:hypothetical protein [Opitutaceae bacterium]